MNINIHIDINMNTDITPPHPPHTPTLCLMMHIHIHIHISLLPVICYLLHNGYRLLIDCILIDYWYHLKMPIECSWPRHGANGGLPMCLGLCHGPGPAHEGVNSYSAQAGINSKGLYSTNNRAIGNSQ